MTGKTTTAPGTGSISLTETTPTTVTRMTITGSGMLTTGMMTMTDAELIERLRSSANRVVNYAGDRIEQLTAERDRAYARGYSDAETEISKSALGQRNDFLHAQYSEAVHRIKDLNELLDEAQTEWSNYSSAWMTAEGKLADAEAENSRLRAALEKISSHSTFANSEGFKQIARAALTGKDDT